MKLIGANKEENFPVKIKKLAEELRVSLTFQSQLSNKLSRFEKDIRKQDELGEDPKLAAMADQVLLYENMHAEYVQEHRRLKDQIVSKSIIKKSQITR